MGAGSSVEVPGGGTEGYHVLRVRKHYIICIFNFFFFLKCGQIHWLANNFGIEIKQSVSCGKSDDFNSIRIQ